MAGAEPWACSYIAEGPFWRWGNLFALWKIGIVGNLIAAAVLPLLALWTVLLAGPPVSRWVLTGKTRLTSEQ